MISDEWWMTSDEWWMTKIEWRKKSIQTSPNLSPLLLLSIVIFSTNSYELNFSYRKVRVFFITQFPSLITLKYHTRLAPSLTCHHSIFFTLFMGPIPVTWSKQSCFVTHRRFSSSSAFSFLISPSPFSPVTFPKNKPEPIKISQAASPLQDCHQWTTPISLTCTAAWSPQWWPSGADEHKETWPISHFVTNDLLRPKTVLPHPFPYSLTLFIYLICVFRIWVLRKMLGFSLNSIFLCFSLLFGWWKNNKGEVFLVFFFVYMILLCLPIAGLLQWFEVCKSVLL